MRIILCFCFIIFLLNSGYSQPKITDLQQFAPDIIRQNGIRKITAYEKDYEKPYYDYKMIIIPDSAMLAEEKNFGVRQSLEIYDTLGRMIQKENFWSYSDLGHIKKVYVYDANYKINAIEHYKDSTLERKEEFMYDMVGHMVLWKVTLFEQGIILFKQYQNDKQGNPMRIKIFMGKELIRKDSIAYTYDNQNRVITEKGYDKYNLNMDSISYKHTDGDTIMLQEIFIGGKRDKTNLQKQNKLYKTFKRTAYSDGDFMGTTYAIFDKKGNISKEKSIHHYAQLNFEKKYYYTPEGIPKRKKIYKNSTVPAIVVTFDVEFFDDIQ